ncbi:MAG TPA: 3-hydroxyacyl-CoA dehydrogenase NAD-binding domain-containing protein [Steroidobacteraceae bacterium]|nr:3-hydroxyacyl-CoA dehydrogenase NAD-binding domain-containing protein [Steroidobacteraceae bacterium]
MSLEREGGCMRDVKTLGLLGTGVIGGGWAARALHFGIDVIAADVKPEMEEWIRGAVANAEPALAKLTFAPLPPKGKLSFTTDAREMAKAADFIQENIPEQLPLKQRLLAEISRHAGPDVIIASSTSGLTPTDLQRDMAGPERFCVAHPFNPVYLLPLVELVPGARTAPETIEASARFFTYIGMHALRVRHEVPGHLTDRLQEAMWREILHMVNEGVATTGELDESIIYGPGLRWAAMGMNLIYHLAGGETGMRHMLAQFGPALKWPWTKLEAPELTETLIDRMVEGTQAQAAGRSIRELERLRDNYLVAIQQVLRQFDIGAGSTLRKLEERLYKDAQGRGAKQREAPASELARFDITVRPEWVDYNGHMSDFIYGFVFGEAMDALYRTVGVDEETRRGGRMFYTVESQVRHLGEAKVSEPLYVTTQVLAVDEKRLHVFHRLYRRRDDALIATGEQMHLHVDTSKPKASAMAPELQARLAAIRQAQARLGSPAEAGKAVGSRA